VLARYLVSVVCVLALVALPRSVSAQPAADDSLGSWQVEAKAQPEEPALELELDPELAEMELRVKRARIGLIGTAVAFPVGVVLLVAGFAQTPICLWEEPCPDPPQSATRTAIAGATLTLGASAGMIATGILLGTRKRQLRELERLKPWPRRVQWDLAQSRLVF
jgi:hypothetical protein